MAFKHFDVPYVEYDGCREYLTYLGRHDKDVWVRNKANLMIRAVVQFHASHEFSDTLEIIEGHRGRSAAQVELESTKMDWYYTMFFGGFLKAMKKLEVKDGKFTCTFRHVQRGQNYGIELVDG